MSFSALDLVRKPGDRIQSEDWNETMHEIERLGKSKLDAVDGALSGTLSVENKLVVGSSENKLQIDSSKKGELSVKTGMRSDQLVFGNGEDTSLVLRENKVGIGTREPKELLDVNGHVTAMPIMGQWYPTEHLHNQPAHTHRVLTLDAETYNTNSNYFEQHSDKQAIVIKVAGYYEITARVLVHVSPGDYGHLYLRSRDGGSTSDLEIDHSHSGTATNWDDRHIHYVGYLEEQQEILLNVYHHVATSYGYHKGPNYTKLNIRKIV